MAKVPETLKEIVDEIWGQKRIAAILGIDSRSFLICSHCSYRLRWSRGSVLAFGTQIRGFKPDRSRRIFKGEKIFSTPSFGGEEWVLHIYIYIYIYI